MADSRDILGDAKAYEKENFIDDVFEASEERPSGWVLPPSLMAVAAVPEAQVINPRVAKDIGEEEEEAYQRFTPVPAVPDPDTQAPRRPKESLDSFDLDLNLCLQRVPQQMQNLLHIAPLAISIFPSLL